jgi:hypothetical protein
MGGGLMQLVAYGAQDIYLTGNPQITFFKVVYRRHTNFSMEAIEQTWNGTSPSSDNGRCTATISRNGDLVSDCFILIENPGNCVCDNPGAYGIDHITLEIGGQQIDKHYGHWMETWAELTQPNELGVISFAGSAETVNDTFQTRWQALTCSGGVSLESDTPSDNVYIPLQFWFNRNPGLALPLIALQYHEVKVILEHQLKAAFTSMDSGNLYCNYIYLDTDERRRFAQVSHEYLIEQVQHQTTSTGLSKDLNFNHPVKELIWTGLMASTPGAAGQFKNIVVNAKWNIKLNGHDRMKAMPRDYFTRYQVYKYHTGCGGVGEVSAAAVTPSDSSSGKICKFNDSIAVYSFALKPEEHQPSGTCNFSRIDNAQLVQEGSGAACEVYAINYNVLRIMSGMGGLAYSN